MSAYQSSRRSIRLKGYDYSAKGFYYVTICTHNRRKIFGNVVNQQIRLSSYGQIANFEWVKLRLRFPHIQLDQFVIMPNHVHGIISVGAPLAGARHNPPFIHNNRAGASPTPTIGNIIGTYKSIVSVKCLEIIKSNHQYLGKIWQRNYYENIIRNNQEINRIRQYIKENIRNWQTDRFYSNRTI